MGSVMGGGVTDREFNTSRNGAHSIYRVGFSFFEGDTERFNKFDIRV